jgi:hypothetical protein
MTPSILRSSNNSSNDTAFCSQSTTTTTTTTTVLPTISRTTTTISRTTTISFSPVVGVDLGVLHRFDYTKQELKSSWYSRAELRTMKRHNKSSVLLKNNRIVVVDDKDSDCLRGLESKTQRGTQQKRQNKLRVREAVFLEQKRQRGEGIWDMEGMADLCYDATEHCQATAHMLGLRDEYEVKEMMLFQQEETSQKAEADDDESVLKEEKYSTIDPAEYCYKPIVLRLYEPEPKLVSSSAA